MEEHVLLDLHYRFGFRREFSFEKEPLPVKIFSFRTCLESLTPVELHSQNLMAQTPIQCLSFRRAFEP